MADVAGLRPTPDRVRETVFNWLAPRIVGARCLDLYAGSGALGIEALSRGAGHVQFIERDRLAVQALRESLAALDAKGFEVIQGDALSAIHARAMPFDIAFVDPPFDLDLHDAALEALARSAALGMNALVYVESPAGRPPDFGRGPWNPWRTGRAGDVGYHLLELSREGARRA